LTSLYRNIERLTDFVGEEDDSTELTVQLAKLEETLGRERASLRDREAKYREVADHRSRLRRNLENVESRREEIDELVARFQLLDQHYKSDLGRLEGIREAGSLFGALGPQVCPLCGAEPSAQRHDLDCDANVDQVVRAADAEVSKITMLRAELLDTVSQLRGEASRFDLLKPRLASDLKGVEAQLEEIHPTVSVQRAAYAEVIEKRSVVQNALSLIAAISDLQARKSVMEAAPAKREESDAAGADLSASTLDKFSAQLEQVLQSWNFPDASRVYFDKETRDFVIAGKPRGSRGKGLRAITHAAFTVSLCEFTRSNDLPHPGFSVLDTPLLAYREPEGEDDDLSGTDVQDRFYEFLAAMEDRQTIVLENNDPPEAVKKRSQTVFFSKNPHLGRYGFFPLKK
jgi:hypothetical protein